jgi:ribosomal protein L11 methyltransferase
MKYWKNITIDLPEIDLEVASDKILNLNILSVTIIDRRNPRESDWFHKSTEPISFNSETHQISILIDEKHDSEELINSITNILGLDENPKYEEEKIKDKDWVEHTHQQFNEISVTNSLRIVPPWSIGSDFDGHTVIIEPGSGFGVGTHPTTQLCLRWMEQNIVSGDSFLDFGSGSGVLSIFAKKLNCIKVEGIEIDQKAIDNAKHNIKLNKVNIPFHRSEQNIKKNSFDNVVANILSETLIDLSPKLRLLTNKRLALSGILNNQVDRVIKKFSEWIELRVHAKYDDWVILDGEL